MEITNLSKNDDNYASSFLLGDVIKFYIEENHTYNDCIQHFNTTRAKFSKFLQDNGIVKNKYRSLNDYLNMINSDEFEQYYKEHSLDEVKEKFFINNNAMLYKILNKLNINKNYSKLDEYIDRIDYKELDEYLKTHTRLEAENKFKIPQKRFLPIIKYFNIKYKINLFQKKIIQKKKQQSILKTNTIFIIFLI